MAIKPALQIRLGQQLRMTPQLQQAIRLLQLSTLDLQQEIQDALDSNLMLEEVGPDDEYEGVETSLDAPEPEPEADLPDAAAEAATEDGGDNRDEAPLDDFTPEPQEAVDPELDGDLVPDTATEVNSESLGDELPVDSAWDDVYDDNFTIASAPPDDNDQDYIDTRNSEGVSLQSHLQEQLNLLNLTDSDEFIALSIVDGLSNDGVLTVSLEEIVASAPAEWELEIEEAEAVLHLIQHLDPVGVASRDLQECLLIQLRALPPDTPYLPDAIIIVESYLSYLASRDYNYISRRTRLKDDDLRAVIQLIQSLNPRPGSDIGASDTEYVEPDVIVSKQQGRWVVELNPRSAPKIRINPEYQGLIKRADTSPDNNYLKNQMQEARWFLKSLQQRNDTLMRVATKIVEFQRGFLEYGEAAMKPLVLHDIAEAVDMHESTISRVTTQKYMHTPAGVFELKYFFSSHVSTNTGGEVSSTAIRALIKELVASENPRKPLSDSKIAQLLADQDIKVARRTIAKYREALMIPPSNERKQLV